MTTTTTTKATHGGFGAGKPAYRYIRATDKLPGLYETDGTPAMAKVKIFNPTGNLTWFIVEYDEASGDCFGMVHGDYREMGYFNIREIAELRGRFGLKMERDLHFTPCPVKDLA